MSVQWQSILTFIAYLSLLGPCLPFIPPNLLHFLQFSVLLSSFLRSSPLKYLGFWSWTLSVLSWFCKNFAVTPCPSVDLFFSRPLDSILSLGRFLWHAELTSTHFHFMRISKWRMYLWICISTTIWLLLVLPWQASSTVSSWLCSFGLIGQLISQCEIWVVLRTCYHLCLQKVLAISATMLFCCLLLQLTERYSLSETQFSCL